MRFAFAKQSLPLLCRGSGASLWSGLRAPGKSSNKLIPSAGGREVPLYSTSPHPRGSGTNMRCHTHTPPSPGWQPSQREIGKEETHCSGTQFWNMDVPAPRPLPLSPAIERFFALVISGLLLLVRLNYMHFLPPCSLTVFVKQVLRKSLWPWGRGRKLGHSCR